MSIPTAIAVSTAPSKITHVQEAHELFQSLQMRVLFLLLQYDQYLFRGQFRTFYEASTKQHPLLQQYDNYIKLRTYSDELLNDIMPRIRRQLSLQTSQVLLYEDAPTRGDIDWQRTLQRSWNEYPGLPPLRFVTHVQQQSMESDENVFAATVLLYYNWKLLDILEGDQTGEHIREQARKALALADKRIDQELAAPYVRALKDKARYADDTKYLAMKLLVEQDEVKINDTTMRDAIDLLAGQVEERLHPGPSPYRDLIVWWQRFGRLTELIQRYDEEGKPLLYHLWIMLELIHFLYTEGRTTPADIEDIKPGTFAFTFRWPDLSQKDTSLPPKDGAFRFIYNEQPGNEAPGWQMPPRYQAVYTIERRHKLEVKYKGNLIWREPPVLLDALSTFEEPTAWQVDDSVRKLLGDMRLHEAEQGIIFSLWPLDPSSETRQVTYERQNPSTKQENERYYHPNTGRNIIKIQLHQLSPASPSTVQSHLRVLLDIAAKSLWERPEPICSGFYLDITSWNAGGKKVTDFPGRILCPKPHIGDGVFDRVSAAEDCLQNPHLCHVIELKNTKSPPLLTRIPTTSKELEEQVGDLLSSSNRRLYIFERDGDEEQAEQLRVATSNAIIKTTSAFTSIYGSHIIVEDNLKWIFKMYWEKHVRCLDPKTRNILISGECAWYTFRQATANVGDWAAPAIHYARALELELNRRLYDNTKTYTLSDPKGGYLSLRDIEKAWEFETNRDILKATVKKSGGNVQQFMNIIEDMSVEKIAYKRNDVAHGSKAIDQKMAEVLRELILGTPNVGGLLYRVAQHLQPL